MNFAGFAPHEFTRWSSMVEQDDPTALPIGLAAVARNVTFHLTSVRTRDGIQMQFQAPPPDPLNPTQNQPITGLASLKYQQPSPDKPPDKRIPLIFDMAGRVFVESPEGSGILVPVNSSLVTPPANAHMQVASAYNRGYLAFSDLKTGQGQPAVYDLLSGNLDPYSMRPVGDRWKASTVYRLGEVITPNTGTTGNGHTYVCIVAGTSGSSQPAFPLGDAGTVTDGTATWKEVTAHAATVIDSIPNTLFTVTRIAGAGSYAAGRDVYIAVTISNGNGESLISAANIITNTVLNDRVQVVIAPSSQPSFPSWLSGLAAPFAPTGVNVYAADVATGAAPPAASAYHSVATGKAPGATVNVDTTGAGAAPPTTNGATITTANAGNICTGIRYMVVLFKNRNGAITGMTEASVISISVPAPGAQQLWVGNIPVGPANTAARVLCFTVAGGSTAGDYFYIPTQDQVSGVVMTSTIIPDNTTTSATLNFTDVYLLSSTKVTSFFRKIQVPNCVDLYFSRSTSRMVVSGASGYPSGWLVSLQNDPESFYGDTAVVQAGENDGERAIAWREFRGASFGLKERGGYFIEPGASDPSTWNVTKRWEGVGPVGPRAVDVSNAFMCFVHRSGVYIFFGDQPIRITRELPKTWHSINWDFAHLIWVLIDEETQEIRIGVPLNDSTVPNAVLKCNYEEAGTDFAPPIYFSPFVGKEIAAGSSRKWSIDDIAAFVAIRAERKLGLTVTDALSRQSQILFASSSPDGAVNAIMPGTFNDNGLGIDCIYETVSTQDLLRVNQLGGVGVNATGFGDLNISIVYGRKNATAPDGHIDLKPLRLSDTQDKAPPSVGARGQNERFRLRLTNGKVANSWFDVKYAVLYARPVASSR
jgi:hypothetical protein